MKIVFVGEVAVSFGRVVTVVVGIVYTVSFCWLVIWFVILMGIRRGWVIVFVGIIIFVRIVVKFFWVKICKSK